MGESIVDFAKGVGLVLLLIFGLSTLICALVTHIDGAECREFCGVMGDASHYTMSNGCYCVTEDGDHYNPKMLAKPE